MAESSAQSDLDRHLLTRLGREEGGALAELYRRFGDRVHRIALGMLPQALDAEDVTQEVFLKLASRIRQFDGRSRLSTWIHRIAVNQCLQRIERERLRTGEPLEPQDHAVDESGPADAAERADETRRARELLARLPEAHRAVLVLREVEELTYAEIARTLEIPIGTVMSRLARARERLAQIAGPEPCPPPRTRMHTPIQEQNHD